MQRSTDSETDRNTLLETAQPILVVKDLRKSYGSLHALQGIDLELQPGDLVGLLGPNGAGKTTLISIICALRRADSGTVLVNGVDVRAHPQKARRFIGLAPQELGIYPIVTVRQNLELFGELTGMSKQRLATQIEAVAVALGLDDLMDRKAGEMSGGQKRRLHTAIALLDDPPLILLDEATTGSDVETRAALITLVKDLAAKGSAVIYSTHYLGEVEDLGATVVILEQGKIIAKGSVAELIAQGGETVVELTFDGQPPTSFDGFSVSVEGSVVRVMTDNPTQSIAPILSTLGADAARLREVEIIKPSLETAYLALTGQRFEVGEELDVASA